MRWAELESATASTGLSLRGGFTVEPEDQVPASPEGRAARRLVLLGNTGAGLWDHFSASPEYGDALPDPLNRWSRRQSEMLAACFGAWPLFPFDGPPYRPFLRWARRAEPLGASPLGMLIHPDYGLWHAYRGALAFAEPFEIPQPEARTVPCESCAGQPCLTACPVGAFAIGRYDVEACVSHISQNAGSDCMAFGCRARRACPIGQAFQYEGAQVAFHMRAFLASRQKMKGMP
jgi:hypothetical protein